MANITESDFRCVIDSHGGPVCKSLKDDPKAFKATFDILKGLASSGPTKYVAIASGVASMSSTAAKYSSASSSTKDTLRATSMTMSTFKASVDLLKLTKITNPGAALAYIGATTVHKTGLAVSLVGADDEKAKCVGALMELSGSAATTLITLPAASNPLTVTITILSAASLAASAFNAYESCKDIPLNGGSGSSQPTRTSSPATKPVSGPAISPLG